MTFLNKHIWLYLILLGVSLTVVSCKKCGQSIGEPSEKKLQLPTFSNIRGHGKLTINLVQDSSYKATIKSEEGLIENVSFEIIDDTLNVYNQNKCEVLRNYEGSVEVSIGVGELNSLLFTSPTQLNVTDSIKGHHLYLFAMDCELNANVLLNYNIVYLEMRRGTSTLNVSGKSQVFWVNEQAFSNIHAFNMQADSVFTYYNSTSLLQVNPQKYFKVYLGGSGIIQYKGNPVKDIEPLAESYSTIQKVD